jgi:hypothetical protein
MQSLSKTKKWHLILAEKLLDAQESGQRYFKNKNETIDIKVDGKNVVVIYGKQNE